MNKQYLQRSSVVAEESLNCEPILEKLFLNRGISKRSDIATGLDNLLKPDGLSGLQEACSLLTHALEAQNKILVIGDYDVDGATATALAVRGLTCLGFSNVTCLVPNRFRTGYGLNPMIIDEACEVEQPDYIITVDNGISSIEGVRHAKEKGIKVIITDHHLPGDTLPEADAIVNPQCCKEHFASSNLAGVGVMFYLCIALRKHLEQKGWFSKKQKPVPALAGLLDLVAIGTVADLVPLDKNNRVLVAQGLKRIRNGKASLGVSALLRACKVNYRQIGSSDISFRVAPKLNAAGRMDDMRIGVSCLLSDDQHKANQLARMLVDFNANRQDVQHDMLRKADDMLRQQDRVLKGVCLYHKDWHEGVIGILASKIKEAIYQPVIIFADGGNGYLKGSARSVSGINIREILAQIAREEPDLLEKFGGHAMAAGMTIKAASLTDFKKRFQRLCSMQDPLLYTETIISDGALEPSEISCHTAEAIANYGVWGQGFEEPLFSNQATVLSKRLIKQKHVQIELDFGHAKPIRAIWFFADKQYDKLAVQQDVQVYYQLGVAEYLGQKQLSIIVKDVECEPRAKKVAVDVKQAVEA